MKQPPAMEVAANATNKQMQTADRGWPSSLGVKLFENMVLRRIFGPKRDEVTGRWKKLHNKEIQLFLFAKYI
jgi:hypothetical protein